VKRYGDETETFMTVTIRYYTDYHNW